MGRVQVQQGYARNATMNMVPDQPMRWAKLKLRGEV